MDYDYSLDLWSLGCMFAGVEWGVWASVGWDVLYGTYLG